MGLVPNNDDDDDDCYSSPNTFRNLTSGVGHTHRYSLVRFVDVFLDNEDKKTIRQQ